MANRFGAFIIGGIAGAVAALLFAPRSGADTRAMVAEKANSVLGDAQDWGAQASANVQNAYQQAAARGAEVVDDVTAKGQGFVDEMVARGQGVVGGVQEAAGNMKPVFAEKNDELREKIEAARQRIAAQVAKNAEESVAEAADAEPAAAVDAEVHEVADAAPVAEEPAAADKQ